MTRRVAVPGEECFTAEPSGARARAVHVSYKCMMQGKLLAAFNAAAKGLRTDLSHICGRFERLDPEGRISPATYVALTGLSEALGSGDVTRVLDSLQEIRVTPDEALFDAKLRIDSVLTETWERPFIENVRVQPTGDTSKDVPILRPILEPEIADAPAAHEALRLLRDVDPDLADEFDEFVCRVKLFAGQGYYGFSSPAAFGAIFMRLPDADPVEYFLEHLVHELSHLNLNAIMAHQRLLENRMDTRAAPLRKDLRPLFQIFHATFVLSRNVRVSRRVVKQYPQLGYDKGLAYFEKKYAEGYETLRSQAQFTDMGRRVFESLEPLHG